MMEDSESFRIYENDRDINMSLINKFADGIRSWKRSSTADKDEEDRAIRERIGQEKEKIREMVMMDIVLEYRFALTYLDKVRDIGPAGNESERQRMISLASSTMEYCGYITPLIEKLGESSGRVQLPYSIQDYSANKIIRSHIHIEKRFLGSYGRFLREFVLDDWLRQVLGFIIEKKTKNLSVLSGAVK